MKNDPTFITSIGVTLTNGFKSPMFTGRKQEYLSDIREKDIPQQIKTIVALGY